MDTSTGEGGFSKVVVLNSPADCTHVTCAHSQMFSFWGLRFIFPSCLLRCTSQLPQTPSSTFLRSYPGLNIHHLIHLYFSFSFPAFTARENLAPPKLHLPLPFQGEQHRISGWKRNYDLQKANTLCPLPSERRRLLLGGDTSLKQDTAEEKSLFY